LDVQIPLKMLKTSKGVHYMVL